MDRNEMVERIREISIPLRELGDLDALVEAIGDAPYVLLGEASHGTSEFYRIRSELTKRLIADKGFHFIAVEGDWPSCYSINRYVKGYPGAAETAEAALQAFTRWPTWMWANREIEHLSGWLKDHNRDRAAVEKAGFYGIDVYSLWESMEEIIRYLKKTGSPELETAVKAFECFEPFARNEESYGISAGLFSEGCEQEVVKLLSEMHEKREQTTDPDEGALSAEMNALVAVNAEAYYRTMVRWGAESWNVRDRHMVDAFAKIVDFHGPGVKAILWEHNTHIGDARATDMADDGMVNVGQLMRERYGADKVFAVGFGTHHGTVIAAPAWGAPLEAMRVPDARPNSWEDLLHRAGGEDRLLLFKGRNQPSFEQQPIGHRAIGVVYHPENERGNYVPSVLAKRYDAFIHIERTEALHPIGIPARSR